MLLESDTERIASELSRALAESDEYKAYRTALAQLKKYPELYATVNEFRKRNFAAQNANMDRITHDVYNSFAAEARKLREDPLINEFLDAELSLGRLIQRVRKIIVSGIDFECDFLK